MAGVDTGNGVKGGRRAIDQAINMVPFIDLLMVTISFLLITAVWSSMARVQTNVALPSSEGKITTPVKEETTLLVRVAAGGKSAKLQFQTGKKIDDVAEVELTQDASGRFPKLEEAIARAWLSGQATHGLVAVNGAVLRTPNDMPFAEMTRVIDAIHSARGPKGAPAFVVTLSTS